MGNKYREDGRAELIGADWRIATAKALIAWEQSLVAKTEQERMELFYKVRDHFEGANGLLKNLDNFRGSIADPGDYVGVNRAYGIAYGSDFVRTNQLVYQPLEEEAL